MVTLANISDLHLDKWSGGMQHGDIQMYRRSTIIKIRSLLNEILRIELLNARNVGDKSGPGMYVASYDLPVSKSGGIAFATLPDFHINLPNGGGVHRVFPINRDQGGEDFVRTYNPGVSAKSDAGNYPAYKYYWEQGNKICFRGAYSEPGEDMNVTVQIFVAAPSTIGENDPLPVSPDHIAEVLRRLDQMKEPVVPVDKTNNLSPQM